MFYPRVSCEKKMPCLLGQLFWFCSLGCFGKVLTVFILAHLERQLRPKVHCLVVQRAGQLDNTYAEEFSQYINIFTLHYISSS